MSFAPPRRLLMAALVVALLPVASARAADDTCLDIYIAPHLIGSLRTSTTPAQVAALNAAVRIAMQPAVPRARMSTSDQVSAAIYDLERDQLLGADDIGQFSNSPAVRGMLGASVLVEWEVGAVGQVTQVALFATSASGDGTLYRGTRQIPTASVSTGTLDDALTALARAAGQKMAPELYCFALSEHNVTIHFNQPAQRRHPFESTLTDLTGAPVSGREVDFGQFGAGLGILTPGQATTASGSAKTVFQAQEEPATIVLTARTKPPYQEALEDRATIAVVDRGLHVASHYALDVEKFCGDKDGWIGAGMQLMQSIMQGFGMAAPGEQVACSGESTEDDDLIIPSFQKTATGYTATAHWISTLRLPSLTLRSSQFTEQGTFTPRIVSFDAQVTATPINGDAHRLQVSVEQFTAAVPTKGGAGSGTLTWAPGSAMAQLIAADKQLLALVPLPGSGQAQQQLQNPSPVDIPADQPMTAIFKLDFPLTIPSSTANSSPLSVSEDVDYEFAAANGLNRLRHVTIDGGFDVDASH